MPASVADALGMKTVHIHPFSGLLSAYGIGLARIATSRVRAVIKPFDETLLSELDAAIAELSDEAREEITSQGVASEEVECTPLLHLRYDGSDTALETGFANRDRMSALENFKAAHRAQFGFSFENKTVVVEAVEVSGGVARHGGHGPQRSAAGSARAGNEGQAQHPLRRRAARHEGLSPPGPRARRPHGGACPRDRGTTRPSWWSPAGRRK